MIDESEQSGRLEKARSLTKRFLSEYDKEFDVTEKAVINLFNREFKRRKTALLAYKVETDAQISLSLNKGRELWGELEEGSTEFLSQSFKENKADITFADDLPIGISFLSDQHIGNMGTDHKRMREDAEVVRDTDGMYCAFGGDGFDNFIKVGLLPAIINAKTSPVDQIAMFEYYMSILLENNKVLFAISGNHEYWTKLTAGIDVVQRLMRERRVLYNQHDFYVNINLGTQNYRIYIRHLTRYNSSINPMHGVKQMLRFGDYDFDIGVAGHIHTAGLETFYHHKQKRLAVRPGSYKVYDTYGEQFGFARAQPTSPVVIFYPDKRDFIGYDDVVQGARILKMEREAYMGRKKKKEAV